MTIRYTLSEIQTLPVIRQGHTDDLLVEVPRLRRVWRSRLTVADGAPYDNAVTVEYFNPTTGGWDTVDQYQPA